MLRNAALAIMVLFMVPAAAAADNWQAFSKYADGFYFLDAQGFDRLTCRVVMPELGDALTEARNRSQASGGAIAIKENLQDFIMVYSPGQGLDVKKPDLRVEVPEQITGPARERIRAGAGMMENGFRQAIDGAAMILEGIFSSYTRPKEPDYKVLEFHTEADRAFFQYVYQGQTMDTVCDETSCERTQLQSDVDTKIRERYGKRKGKKVIQNLEADIISLRNTIKTNMSVSYQEIQGVVIPESITGSTQVSSPTLNMTGNVNVLLTDCRTE